MAAGPGYFIPDVGIHDQRTSRGTGPVDRRRCPGRPAVLRVAARSGTSPPQRPLIALGLLVSAASGSRPRRRYRHGGTRLQGGPVRGGDAKLPEGGREPARRATISSTISATPPTRPAIIPRRRRRSARRSRRPISACRKRPTTISATPSSSTARRCRRSIPRRRSTSGSRRSFLRLRAQAQDHRRREA